MLNDNMYDIGPALRNNKYRSEMHIHGLDCGLCCVEDLHIMPIFCV